jgi:hypothetical protein
MIDMIRLIEIREIGQNWSRTWRNIVHVTLLPPE